MVLRPVFSFRGAYSKGCVNCVGGPFLIPSIKNMKKFLLLSCVLLVILILTGCEREGIVNTDDCREVVNIKDGGIQTYYKTFTCSYYKTDKGDIMGGTCTNVKTGLFNSKCEIAYVYEKEPYKKCSEDEYLAKSGNCNCITGVKRKNKCISYDDDCKLSFGDNVQGSVNLSDENTSSCRCALGYGWNSEKTKCIYEDLDKYKLPAVEEFLKQ